jgi:hypothetical protein
MFTVHSYATCYTYNRKYIPVNGESLTLVHTTILIKKYLRNKTLKYWSEVSVYQWAMNK